MKYQTPRKVDSIIRRVPVKTKPALQKHLKSDSIARLIRKAFKKVGTSVLKKPTNFKKLGIVGIAAAYGAHRITKASNAAIKEIESQHSPARMKSHRDLITTIQAQRKQSETKPNVTKPDVIKPTKFTEIKSPKAKAATALRKTTTQTKKLTTIKKPAMKNMATIWNPNKLGSKQRWKIGKPMPSKGFQLWTGGKASEKVARTNIKTKAATSLKEASGKALATKRKLTWSALNKIDKASLIKQSHNK